MTENIEEKLSPCFAEEKISTKQVKEPGRRGRPKAAKANGDKAPFVLKVREDGRPRKRQGKGSGKAKPELVLRSEDIARTDLIRPVGRPTLYNDELVNTICERLIAGESLVKICSDEEMPGISSIWGWLDKYPEFLAKYTRAKEYQTETYIDKLIDIAENTEDVQRARLITDSVKWLAGKSKPKKYGDRIDINKTVDITVTGIKRVIVDEVIEGEVIATDKLICCDSNEK